MTVKTEGAAAGRSGARASGRGPGQNGTVEHLSRADREALGKDARAVAPLESHAEFSPGPGRDPVGLLLGQAASRVPELVPVRHGRMLVSPFTFYRGAALPMAADLAGTPAAGLRVQLCGDAHLSNFGAFASPERNLVFDVNDFDETRPGPFEWDVKRLAASMIVAGRSNGFTAKDCRKLALAAGEGYRTAMRGFAEQTFLDVWYAHLSNFGAFASPERNLVFDVNDFDETLPGPFEWDVKRLAASLAGGRAGQRVPRQGPAQDRPGGGRRLPHRDARVRGADLPGRVVRAPRHRAGREPVPVPDQGEKAQGVREAAGQGPYPGQHPGTGQAHHRGRRPTEDHQ